LHARCLAAIDPQAGETVLHIGAGSGYYTAILAELVGPAGAVHAYEIERELAQRAQTSLAGRPNAQVHCASGSEASLPMADVIYVNAGVTRPEDRWIDALKVGGRLAVPITPKEGYGGMLMVTRLAADAFAARILCRVSFIEYRGGRGGAEAAALAKMFEPNSFRPVRSFHRFTRPDATAWFAGSDWWLSTAEPR
jgi:protein-L-isoaspartate(D-aspartate) O-methyltransferase